MRTFLMMSGTGTLRQGYRRTGLLRDRERGRTSLISKTSGGEPAADGHSGNPSISGDGRFVAFLSQATNLPGAGTWSLPVYVHDWKAGEDPPKSVRLAEPSDAPDVARLLHDFNTEYDDFTPGVEVLNPQCPRDARRRGHGRAARG